MSRNSLPSDASAVSSASPVSDGESTPELRLVQLCAAGDMAARDTFARDYLSHVPQAVRHLGPAAFGEEVRQLLSLKLLHKPEEGEAKVAEYTGRGALGAWVRVAAVRLALDLLKSAQRERKSSGRSLAELPDPFAPADGMHVQLLRMQHQDHLQAALRDAFAKLDGESRTAMKLHYLHGLSTDETARILGVHKATAARWIAQARGEMLEGTLRALRERLGVSATEAQSLVKLVDSHFDCTTESLLGDVGP